jgi:hypothetical protein
MHKSKWASCGLLVFCTLCSQVDCTKEDFMVNLWPPWHWTTLKLFAQDIGVMMYTLTICNLSQ